MGEYISHWWNGDLNQCYHLLGLTISQVNKLFKIAQYLTGLLAIFELVQFSTLMGKLRWLSYLSIASTRFVSLVFTLPNLMARLAIGVYLVIRGRKSYKEMVKDALSEHIWSSATRAQQVASHHPSVRMFQWLERHPLSDNLRRVITFVSFAAFSLGELLTS